MDQSGCRRQTGEVAGRHLQINERAHGREEAGERTGRQAWQHDGRNIAAQSDQVAAEAEHDGHDDHLELQALVGQRSDRSDPRMRTR